MIGSLRGTVLERLDDATVLVEVGGVGYLVAVTPRTLAELEPSSPVFLYVHHHIREDAQTLYGFAGREERDVFETLIGTHGVGPALGLAILSTHSPRALRLAIATDDVSALCLVPGVGRKTAQRLLVELKSRLDGSGDVDLRALAADGASPSAATGPSAHADVRDALVGLGYGNEEIAGVVGQLPLDGDASDLLRQALQKLAVA